MMGRLERDQFRFFCDFYLGEHVSSDNLIPKLYAVLDLGSKRSAFDISADRINGTNLSRYFVAAFTPCALAMVSHMSACT